jgi:GNAT superfamily N-acetyltransferase
MMNEPVVRCCEERDLATISAREPAGRNYARTTFARQKAGDCLYLVAWLDGEPVGSGELEWADVPELRNLQVDQDHRNHGIGTAITNAAEQAASPRGRLAVGVAVDNADARRLYQRLGYQPTTGRRTFTYTYIDDDGHQGTATEIVDYLVKPLDI